MISDFQHKPSSTIAMTLKQQDVKLATVTKELCYCDNKGGNDGKGKQEGEKGRERGESLYLQKRVL